MAFGPAESASELSEKQAGKPESCKLHIITDGCLFPHTLGVELPLALSLISYEAATHVHSQETCWLESVKSTWQSAEAHWQNVKCFELFNGRLPQHFSLLRAATFHLGRNDSALRSVHERPQRRRRQKSDSVEELWRQLNGLISKTVVNWWLVKSDQRDRSSFV